MYSTYCCFKRGAELIEELRQKQMKTQEEQEKKILQKIKVKMDRIKANQQKLQGPAYKEPTNHFVGKICCYNCNMLQIIIISMCLSRSDLYCYI